MKNLIANRRVSGLSAAILAFVVAAAIPSTQASAETGRVVATVPFDFQIGSDHLKAGRYTIDMTTDHVMRLHSGKNNGASISRLETDNRPAASTKLIFTKYGSSRYFLREVWLANANEHQVLAKSKAEKRQLNAMNVTERNGVEVALLEPLQ